MNETAEETSNEDFERKLFNKIQNSNYGIKYPNNILSCLKYLNAYDHLKICPHYCPAGRIIKITKTPTEVLLLWIEVTSQILPVQGENLYILEENFKFLLNNFILIGSMEKCFTKKEILMFSVNNSTSKISPHHLKIGAKIYFKHWDQCSIRLVEIPEKGIRVPVEINQGLMREKWYDLKPNQNPYGNSSFYEGKEPKRTEFQYKGKKFVYIDWEKREFSKKSENPYENIEFQKNSSDLLNFSSASTKEKIIENHNMKYEIGSQTMRVESNYLNEFSNFRESSQENKSRNIDLYNNSFENSKTEMNSRTESVISIIPTKISEASLINLQRCIMLGDSCFQPGTKILSEKDIFSYKNDRIECRKDSDFQIDSQKNNWKSKLQNGNQSDNFSEENSFNISANTQIEINLNSRDFPVKNSNVISMGSSGNFVSCVFIFFIHHFDLFILIIVFQLFIILVYIMINYK